MAVDIAGHNRVHGDYMTEQPIGEFVRGIITQMDDRFDAAVRCSEAVLLCHPDQYSLMLLVVLDSGRK